MKFKNLIKALSTILVILILWFYVTNSGMFNAYVLPSPQRVFDTFTSMVFSGELFTNIVVSLRRVLIGFSFSFVVAFLLGLLSYRFPKAYPYYSFIIEFMRNVPPLATIPLLILWFGIGESTKIIMIFLASFFPIFLSIQKGFFACDKQLIEVGKSLNMSDNTIFKKIVLPSATSDILVGMRIGLGYSWRAIIGAEMIAAASGLGYMVLFAQQMSRSDKVIIGIIIIGLVGFISDYIFGLLIKRFIKEPLTNG